MLNKDWNEFHKRSELTEKALNNIEIQTVKRTKKEWQEQSGYGEEEIDEYSEETGEILFSYQGKVYVFKRIDYFHSWYWDSYWWVTYSLRDKMDKNKETVLWEKATRDECYRYLSKLLSWHKGLALDMEQCWEWDIDKREKFRTYGKKSKIKKSYKK